MHPHSTAENATAANHQRLIATVVHRCWWVDIFFSGRPGNGHFTAKATDHLVVWQSAGRRRAEDALSDVRALVDQYDRANGRIARVVVR